jgi:hypothetical protein
MVGAGDSAGEGAADGADEALGSAAIALMATSAMIVHDVLIQFIDYHRIDIGHLNRSTPQRLNYRRRSRRNHTAKRLPACETLPKAL